MEERIMSKIQPTNMVLDTNVLLTDPMCIYKFDEHTIIIPSIVLQELDSIKDRRDKVNVNREAREAIKILLDTVDAHPPELISKGVEIKYPEGVKPKGGKLRVISAENPKVDEIHQLKKFADSPDGSILAITAFVQEEGAKTILVTNDLNLRLIASTSGIEAQPYKNEYTLSDLDLLSSGISTIKVNSLNDLDYEQTIEDGKTIYEIDQELLDNPAIGELIVGNNNLTIGTVHSIGNGKIKLAAKTEINMTRDVWGVKPKNFEQAVALDLLEDPSIPAVVLFGPAGTGKTFLSMASAVNQVINERRYDKIILTRSTTDLDDGLGYTPGTETDKMKVWLGGFDDALESLHAGEDKNQGKFGSAEYIAERASIQLLSINYMRGRTFNNSLIILDECQNLSRHQIKSIASRVGRGSKIIFLGNTAQIDAPWLTAHSCGLSHIVEKSRGYAGCRALHLQGKQRSEFAGFAEECL